MMNNPFWQTRTVLLLLLILPGFAVNHLHAEDNSHSVNTPLDIESVLDGFDDTPAAQQPQGDIDNILETFDDDRAEPTPTNNRLPGSELFGQPSNLQSKSSIQLSIVSNYAQKQPQANHTDYRGTSRLRIKLQSELQTEFTEDWKALVSFFAYHDAIFAINGREKYSPEMLESFENEAELLDTFLQGSVSPSTDLKLGRQIIPWGNSENIRVVDVLNPLDLREPGMTDIADLRLPVTAAKLDYYFGSWNLSLIAIPEIRFNKFPPYGSDFYPGTVPSAPEQDITDGGSNTETGVAFKGIFQGWDLSFHWAQFFDDDTHHELINYEVVRTHSRLTLHGVAANGSSGNWLIKSEFAKISGLKFFSDPYDDYIRFDLLIGVEYAGMKNSVLAIESVKRRVDEYQPILSTGPDSTDQDVIQTVLRYSGNFLHDRLKVIAVGSFYGAKGEQGFLYRVSGDYEFLNSMVVTAGVVTYHSGKDPYFQFIRNNDRVFLDITYNF